MGPTGMQLCTCTNVLCFFILFQHTLILHALQDATRACTAAKRAQSKPRSTC
jgi:hypothetical protein